MIGLQEQRQYNDWIAEQKTIVSKKQFDKMNETIKYANKQYNQKYKVSLEEQNNVMLKALFERFFTSLDVKRWENDRIIVANTTDVTDLNYLSAQQRLNQQDGRAYFSRK